MFKGDPLITAESFDIVERNEFVSTLLPKQEFE